MIVPAPSFEMSWRGAPVREDSKGDLLLWQVFDEMLTE